MAKGFNDLPAPVQGLIFIVLALLLAGAAFWYFVLPLSDQKDALDRDVKKLKAENDKNEAFRQQLLDYKNRIAQLATQLETLRTIVPDEQATDEFMKQVFANGSTAGVNIRTFIPKPPATHDFYVEVPFSMRIDGTYYELLKFFKQLSGESRIMNISNLTLGSPEGGGMGSYKVSTSETVGANCTLTTYYNRPMNAPAPPPQKPK